MNSSVALSGTFIFGSYRLDSTRRALLHNGSAIALPPRVFDTLLYLVENAGRLVERTDLIQHVWNGRVVEDGSINQAIYTIRKMFRSNDISEHYVVTSPTRGYRFVALVQREINSDAGSAATRSELQGELPIVRARPPEWRTEGQLLPNSATGFG